MSTKPGIRMRLAGIDHRGVARAAMFGRTSRILPSSISTSRLREVADLAVERKHDAALDENAARALQAGEVGLGLSLCRERLRRRGAGDERTCGLQYTST